MSKVAKATMILMIATMLSKVLGFIRELVLASTYGASMYSDAYIIAMNIPMVIFSVIGTTLGTVFIPMYFDVKNNYGSKKALDYTNNVFNIIIIICIILGIVGLIFTKSLVKLFAIGLEGQMLNITIDFTRITIVGIVFTGLSYIMTAYLQINSNFTIPGLITIPKNIAVIISIILSNIYCNPYIMVWGTLVGTALEFLFQYPFVLKFGYRYKLYVNINDEHIIKTLKLICPVLLGVAVNQINALVDRNLASTLAEGSISALNYANRLNSFIMALFISTISAVIYPTLSKISNKESNEGFVESVVNSMNYVILLIMPISVGAIVLSNPIVEILFERGAFDSNDTRITAIALSMYSIGMVSFGLREILGKVFYSLQDTRTPMINGTITMAMNVILNIILIRYFKVSGLALATSISSIICIILLFKKLNDKIEHFNQNNIRITMIKSMLSSIIMGLITYFSYDFMNNVLNMVNFSEILSLIISIVLGIFTYGVLLIILKVNEISTILEIIKNKKYKKVLIK